MAKPIGLIPIGRMILIAAFFAAGMAHAESLEDKFAKQMLDQGYDSVRVSRTLLGRILIIAVQDGSEREIVVHPYTGEVLRDYVRNTSRLAIDDGDDDDSGGILPTSPPDIADDGGFGVSVDQQGDQPSERLKPKQ